MTTVSLSPVGSSDCMGDCKIASKCLRDQVDEIKSKRIPASVDRSSKETSMAGA